MKNNKAFLFFLPALIFLLLFSLIPMIQIFYYSFLEYNLVEDGKFIGLNNYIRLFADENFWATLINSLLYILVTPILIIISLSAALLVRSASSGSKIFRSLFFFPVITPLVIAGIIWRWLFAEDFGLINYLLSLFNINKVNWLSEYPTNMLSVMILTVWRGFGYYMMIFLAGLSLIPKEMEESAKLDGANIFQQVIHIVIPQLKPTIIFIFVVSSAAAIKIFTEIYIMIPGSPMDNKTLVSFLFREAFERFNFGYSSAIGVILFIITLGFSYINIRLMEKNWQTE